MPLNITTPDGGSASVGIPSEGQTMRLAIGTGMVDAALVAKDFYNAVNLNPEYVADFFESYYRVNKVPSTFSGALNFSRTGTATYTDSTGTLQTAATGVARTDHHIWDGSAWVNQGLLLESDAATNFIKYSFFDAGVPTNWSVGFGTGTFSHTLGTQINGQPTITHVQSTSGRSYLAQSLTLSASTTYTFSMKVDLENSEYVSGGASIFTIIGFTGVPTTSKSLVDVDPVTGLLTATFTTGSDGIGGIRIGVGASSDGVGTLVWSQPQLEANSTPTSYIKTEATTATRNAETLTASAADLPYNLTAVSVQMEGTVSGTPSTLIDWQADASNLITLSAGASDFTFTQEQAGTVDSVTGGSYTPGINVPFNIASRHGSTFINGAVDGVALTANTTPTALPDLTATDLEIAPNFNGTIKLLRIWGSDIGDTGIAAASD